jgi:SulP family sulfate permease
MPMNASAENSRQGYLLRRVPALDSLRNYSARDAEADFVAGLTVAAVAVPQAVAYAIAAGVPPEHGLYTAIVMTAVGALFASSRQLINGPTNVISIAVLSALAPLAAEDRVAAAVSLALLVGLFQTAITLLRLGDLTRYISHSVVVGFTLGASALLVLDQTRNLLGWAQKGTGDEPFIVRLYQTWTQGGMPHPATTAIGVGSILLIVALRWLKNRLGWELFPELFAVVALAAVAVWALGLDQYGVKVVGEIPAKLPAPTWPRIPLTNLESLGGSALAIAALGLLEALAMSKHLAAQTGEKLDVNQQCLSEGLANLTGSFFQCIPGSGSLTRSAINHQAGARTQWSGVWSAVAVGLIVLLCAPLARYIPRAALAGLLIVSSYRMVDWGALWFHLRATRYDAMIVVATAFAAVAISVEFCILIGVVFSFVLAVPRAGRMTRTEFVVGQDGVTRERVESEPVDPHILIFGLEGELFFGATRALDEHLAYLERRLTSDVQVVVLRCKRLRNPDAVGLKELDRFIRRLHDRGVHVILAGVTADVMAGLRHTGTLEFLGSDQVFTERARRGTSTMDAIKAAHQRMEGTEGASRVGATPAAELRHFQE